MKREVIVGAFVLVGLAVTGTVIYTIGQERRVFAGKVEYRASFPDVQGLKPGAPVRLSGVDIGTVKAVEHGPNAQDDRLYVRMEIVRDEASRIREDSVARVANKGLLGDKMLEVTPGTPGRRSLPPGAVVQSEDPTDYANMLTQLGDMAHKVEKVLSNLEKTTGTFAEEQTRKDMQDSLHSMTIILNGVATGKGYAGRLINDPAEADRISHTLGRLDGTVTKLNTALDGFNQAVDRVNKGTGFAHAVVYEDGMSKSVVSIGNAADEVTTSMKAIRQGNGMARALLFGGPGQEQVGENLTAMSADLRTIVANVKAGKGTVGALLVDPSIYEDMKAVLGNVQRNDVLRALVRYSIKQDEKKPEVHVGGSASTPPASSAPRAALAP